MESEMGRGCQGDASSLGSAFSRADKMRFNTLTYEIIEELKMRRELAAENEKKIEKLMNERYTMGWKLDQECGKVANLGERHEAELRETRRELEEKMRDCQVEASQQQVYRKMAEKEKDALKDEIRRLQLANYTLEKKVRESECKEKIQANEREQHIHQVSRFESQFGQLDAMMKQLTSKQDQLDADMKHVKNLNKSLQYQNSHQKCILDIKEADLVKVTQELLDTKVKVKIEPGLVQEREEELQNEVKRLKEFVKKLEEDYSSLDKDKDSWKEKYWDSLKKLDNAHRLINVHLHNAAKYRDECGTLEELQKATQDKLSETEHSLQQSREDINDIQLKHQTEVENFESKISKLNVEINGLNTDVDNMSKQKEETEQALQKANDTIEDLEKQLTDVKAILNIEKFQVESQTQLQMLEMIDSEVQAIPPLQNQEVLARVEVETGVTQTIDPALCSTEVQTDIAEINETEVQTDCVQEHIIKHVADTFTQTDLEMKGYDMSVCSSCTGKTDGEESTSAIYIENSPENVKANVNTALSKICQKSSFDENKHNADLKKCKKDLKSGEYTSIDIKVDNDKNQRYGVDGKIGLSYTRFEGNKTNRVNEQLRINRFEETFSRNGTIVESGGKCSTLNETTLRVQSGEAGDSYKNLKAETFLIDNYHRNDTSESGRKSHASIHEKQEIGITRNIMLYEGQPGREIGKTGLSIPKIDIEKSINNPSVVIVDPDEFSIELTQDEKVTKDSNYEKGNLENRNMQTSSINELRKGGIQSSNCHQIESHLSEQIIEQKWQVSEKPSKLIKSKAKKHKLTKEIINNNFTDFDKNKEKFVQCINRDEVLPKHPKIIEIEKNQQRGMPKKQRNYSAMFQVQEVIDKIDESDTEEMITAVKEDQEYNDVPDNLKNCSSANVQQVSQYQISANYSIKNRHGTNMLPGRGDKVFKESVINSFSSIQPRLCTSDLSSSRIKPIQSMSNQPDNRIFQETCDAPNFNHLSSEHLKRGSFDLATDRSDQDNHLAKHSSLDINVAYVEDESESPNTLTQSDASSQELTEVNDPLTDEPDCPGSTKNISKPHTSLSANDDHNVSKIPLNTSNKTNYPAESTTNERVSSVDPPSSYATSQSPITGTRILGKSNVSNSSSGQTGGSTDFLQKYKDIVAKIKPMQTHSSKQTKVIQKNKEHPVVSPANTTVQAFIQRVSPRERTPKSILKGSSKKSQNPRNVTWNEYTMNKEFVKDDNISDEDT